MIKKSLDEVVREGREGERQGEGVIKVEQKKNKGQIDTLN